jgi:haloalkane dehalogenase
MNGQVNISKPSAAFPFESRFVTVDGHRIHYVEEGRGDPVLFIHGNPTSSYLWRNILPKVAGETGRRGIALDLLGFGKSDKPDVEYTVRLHYRIVEGFIEQLGLKNLILVLHDWGGPLGTHFAVRNPELIRGIALMETPLWEITWEQFGRYRLGFKLFRSPLGHLLIQVMNVFVNQLLPGAVVNRSNMTAEVMRRYRAPFPTVRSRRAVRVFPQLIPIEGEPAESDAFFRETLAGLPGLNIPLLYIRATPGLVGLERLVLGLKERLPRLVVKEFGPGLHYIQEDDPDKVARLLEEWIRESGV